MAFKNDKRLEKKMKVNIDNIYHQIFPTITTISRANEVQFYAEEISGLALLDKELGIDTIIRFENGSFLTLQEKCRRYNNLSFNDFTFEYYNDPYVKSVGEWFKLAAQLYFYGYTNQEETDICKYFILNIPEFRLFLLQYDTEKIKQKLEKNTKHGRANFLCISFNEIPKKCIMKSFTKKEKKLPQMADYSKIVKEMEV